MFDDVIAQNHFCSDHISNNYIRNQFNTKLGVLYVLYIVFLCYQESSRRKSKKYCSHLNEIPNWDVSGHYLKRNQVTKNVSSIHYKSFMMIVLFLSQKYLSSVQSIVITQKLKKKRCINIVALKKMYINCV